MKRRTKRKKIDICQECKAVLKYSNEYHPHEYCLMAKADPLRWRERLVTIIVNGDRYGTRL